MANVARKTREWSQNENSGSRMAIQRNTSSTPASYFGPLSNFFSDMDRMLANRYNDIWALQNMGRNFGFPLISMPGMNLPMFQPNVDITSNDNEYTITAEVPGLEEKDVKLTVSNDGMLSISGEKRQENTRDDQDVYYCTECSYGAFERTFSLPDDVDPDNIEANFHNGVLTVTCPRMERSSESARQSRRKIPINGGKGSEGARASNTNERGTAGAGSRKAA